MATDSGNSAANLVQPSNCLHRILSQRRAYATPRSFLAVREVSGVWEFCALSRWYHNAVHSGRLEVGTCWFSHILVAGGLCVDTTCR